MTPRSASSGGGQIRWVAAGQPAATRAGWQPVKWMRALHSSFVVTMFAVAGGVVAVTIFNMTIAKIPSIALLKLIGSPDRVIVSMIVQSSLLLGCIAYGGAMLVAHQLYPHFPRTVVLLASDHAQFFVLTMLICIAASWVGINRAFRVHAREVLA